MTEQRQVGRWKVGGGSIEADGTVPERTRGVARLRKAFKVWCQKNRDQAHSTKVQEAIAAKIREYEAAARQFQGIALFVRSEAYREVRDGLMATTEDALTQMPLGVLRYTKDGDTTVLVDAVSDIFVRDFFGIFENAADEYERAQTRRQAEIDKLPVSGGEEEGV